MVNAGFLAAMHFFGSCSWKMTSVSIQTKLDKFYSSISCLTDLFGWAFTVLISFHTILCCDRWPHLGWSEKTSSFLKLWKDFWDVAYWNCEFLWLLAHILGHLHYLLPHFWNFSHYLDVRIFTIFKKKSVLLWKNICMLEMECFSAFKYCILIDLWCGQKLLHGHFWDGLISSFIQNP